MPTPKINQKYGLPRLDGKAGFPLSRGKFLDGTTKTYFGPKHRPNLFADYHNPGDWNPAGTLLRVPRVVWLQTWQILGDDTFGASLDQSWANFYTTPQVLGEGFVTFGGIHYYQQFGVGTDTGPGGWQNLTTTANADYAERQRLLSVFQAAKDRVEALQPGRIWVEIIDWNDRRSFDADVTPYATPTDGSYDSDGFMQIAAPPTDDPGPFFGTDFLNIWAGAGLGDGSALRAHFSVYTPAVPPESDTAYGNPKARLVGTYDRFRDHATILFRPDQAWVAPAVIPDPAGIAPFYVAYETVEPAEQAGASAFMDFLADDLADFGFSHPGGTSSITEDSLVALIADHYHFDPVTGMDLG